MHLVEVAISPGLSEELGQAPELAFLYLKVVISFFLVAEKILIWESHPAEVDL